MMDGGFPIDLVLFGLVAAFLVLRLISILGKRTGYERPSEQALPDTAPRGPMGSISQQQANAATPTPARPAYVLPDPETPVGQTLAAMAQIDRSFSPQRFIDGAEAAFRMIVTGFAKGERTTLHPLLSRDTYAAFEAAIAARETDGHVQHTDIKSIENVTIDHAELHGTLASISVRIVSDQVNLTVDASGHPIAGTDAVTEIVDFWTFERDLAQSDPAWRLVAAHSA